MLTIHHEDKETFYSKRQISWPQGLQYTFNIPFIKYLKFYTNEIAITYISFRIWKRKIFKSSFHRYGSAFSNQTFSYLNLFYAWNLGCHTRKLNNKLNIPSNDPYNLDSSSLKFPKLIN